MTQWIISSGVLIAVVIALRFALRGKISLRMQYALWLLVLARLLVPVSFGTSDLSVMNAVPDRLPSIQQSVTIPTENATTPVAPLVPAQGIDAPLSSDFAQNTTVADTTPKAEKTDWAGIARTVWLTGAVVLGLTFLTSNLRFGRKLRRSRRSIENTGASLPVYESAETETPCLFGLIKPSIYVTPDACADASTLRYALAHEQTHYRHGDHLWAVLRGVCLALHWYNPLVWWAAELSRRDAELACDETTIHTLGEAERAAYGRTLIRMTSEKRPALLVTATMMTDSGKGLRERITLLVKKPKTAVYTAAAVLLIAGISVACTFTNGHAALTDPFGKEYSAEIVYCELDLDISFAGGTMPGFRIGENGKRIITVLHITGEESRSGAVEEVELTKESFDSLFRDDVSGWTGKALNAAKLRRATVNAWHGTLLGETNWPMELYLLQQKDGTLYLAMGYDKETVENLSGRAPFFRWVFRLNEKTMPVYDSMEDYALSRINAIRESGIVYNISDKDGNATHFSDTVEDVRVMELSCLGELSDFAPDGTLELWRFSAEAKPSNKENRVIELVGGQNLSDDGYYFDGYSTYLVMLRKDDGFHTLRSFISNDGYEVGRYPTVGAYLHDAYCEIMGFLGPYSLIESLFRYTDGYGREVSDNGILTHGDGWYFYLPSGDAWIRGGIHDLWYSAYNTESTITVNAFDTTVEETAASLISDGWTKETSGALTVYRRCCPALPQSLIPSFDAYESVYLYERPEGGHYEVLTVWYDLADEVNEWGWSPKAQVAAERTQLETMVQSFTVVPVGKTGVSVSLPHDEQAAQYIKRAFSHDISDDTYRFESSGGGETIRYTVSDDDYYIVEFRDDFDYPSTLYHFCHLGEDTGFDLANESDDYFKSEMVTAAKSFLSDVFGIDCKAAEIHAYGYKNKISVQIQVSQTQIFQVRFHYQSVEPVGVLFGNDLGAFEQTMERYNAKMYFGNTSTPEFIHDIGRTLSELKNEYPEGEFIVKPDGFPGHAAVCFGVPKAEYLYYFFGTQSGDAEKAMNECEDRLKCAGFLTTTNVLFPEMKDDMGFEDFFSLIGVEDYEYFGEDTITAEGWLRFTYNDMEVMVNTNEPSSGGGWNVTGAEIVKSDAPASIVDPEILKTNQNLAEPVMFD